jgi:hypothetical protein
MIRIKIHVGKMDGTEKIIVLDSVKWYKPFGKGNVRVKRMINGTKIDENYYVVVENYSDIFAVEIDREYNLYMFEQECEGDVDALDFESPVPEPVKMTKFQAHRVIDRWCNIRCPEEECDKKNCPAK